MLHWIILQYERDKERKKERKNNQTIITLMLMLIGINLTNV